MTRIGLSIFDWFLVTHFVGDYLLQTLWMAMGKSKGRFWNWPLVVHCAGYTAPFLPVMLYLDVSLFWLAPIYFTHMVIDRRTPVIQFIKWKEGKLNDPSYEPPFWLVIMVDQIFHIIVLLVIAALA